MKYTREIIEQVMASKGYKYFHDNRNKGYDVNIIGIRNSETKGRVTNAFDDTITIAYKCEAGAWHYHEFECTTDPGTAWMENPWLKEIGCAILKPGQYRGSHKIRLHGGKYTALGQNFIFSFNSFNSFLSPLSVHPSNTTTGIFGINIHRATAKKGGKSIRVGKYSAGCQVIASNDDWYN
jgi:hypothetical protein